MSDYNEKSEKILQSISHRLGIPSKPSNGFEIGLAAFIAGAELCVTFALSKFSGRQSTVAQRAWIITWLVAGFAVGGMIDIVKGVAFKREDGKSLTAFRIAFFCTLCIHGAPAIGGLVVVSQMLKAYGTCYKFV